MGLRKLPAICWTQLFPHSGLHLIKRHREKCKLEILQNYVI